MSRRTRTIVPGDRFKLTGAFLKKTGQQVGPEGQSVWVAQSCACNGCQRGSFVLSDQESYDGIGYRHFGTANIQWVK